MKKNYDKKKNLYNSVIEILCIAFLLAVAVYYFFGFNNLDFSYPCSYAGDAITGVLDIKRLITGDHTTNGWPFFVDTSSYSAVYNMMYRLLIKFLGCFTSDYYLIFNIYLFLIPWFNAFIFYFVIRELKVRRWLAFVGAVCFGFCPYVQYRLPGHMALASIECIPLVILLIFWLYEDSNFNSINGDFFKKQKNWASILFAWMIANNGMIYYPFFSCFILVIISICIWLRERKIKRIIPCIITVGEIVFFVALSFVPTAIGIINGVGNVATNGASRNALRATEYGLNLFALLLSPKAFSSDGIFEKYSYILSWSNENEFAYMGILAIVGFIILLVRIFRADNVMTSSRDTHENRIFLFSRVNIAILLISVLGGGGVIVALIVPFISCYNRISPFIVCICIMTVLLMLEKLLKTSNRKRMLLCASLLFSIIGIWDVQGCYGYFDNNVSRVVADKVDSDREFIEKIEEICEKNSMIYMLPYMRSFENGPVYNIIDYDHFKAALYSDSLRWSFGGSNNSKNDQWYYETSTLEPQKLVEEIRKQGFSGIYINLDGYEVEEGISLKNELCQYCGDEKPIIHDNGQIYYIAIKN